MDPTRSSVTVLLLVCAASVAGCGSGARGSDDAADTLRAVPDTVRVTSPDIPRGGTIPSAFTCSGKGGSPALAWSGIPAKARDIVVMLEDPDAPGGTFLHWFVRGLKPSSTGLRSGASGLTTAETSAGKSGYAPPCPPKGDPDHRYVFRVIALKEPLVAPGDASAAVLQERAGALALAQGTLVARFGR